jgi:hypothetical protein
MILSAAAFGGAFFIIGIPFAGLLATWFSSAQLANFERRRRSSSATKPGLKRGAAIAIDMTLDRFGRKLVKRVSTEITRFHYVSTGLNYAEYGRS